MFEVLQQVLAEHGLPAPVGPNDLVNSDNLPDLVADVFGRVEVVRRDIALVVLEPEPIIAYCASTLTLSGVAADSLVRRAVVAGLDDEIRRRFGTEGATWRDLKGYVICIATGTEATLGPPSWHRTARLGSSSRHSWPVPTWQPGGTLHPATRR